MLVVLFVHKYRLVCTTDRTSLVFAINRVARKLRTYSEMETDGQRFVGLKSGINILRRYL